MRTFLGRGNVRTAGKGVARSHEAYLPSPRLDLYPSGVCGGVFGDVEEEAVNISCKPKPFRIQ